ncbi:Rid family hydrolase, partial [Serratia ureilytica]|uniref:Rid family hydrolase n=1 Tax=Serratia ureilytica TaxID=300181 RepID=UPI00370461D1
GTVCVVGKMRDLILQLSKSSIYSTKPLTDVNDVKWLDDIYRKYFNYPYPNRSTVIVEKLVVPGMKIEITVSAIA